MPLAPTFVKKLLLMQDGLVEGRIGNGNSKLLGSFQLSMLSALSCLKVLGLCFYAMPD